MTPNIHSFLNAESRDSLLCLPRIPSVSYQHLCGTLIADLLDGHGFLVGSTSESKGWQSLPRPVVECIQAQGVHFAKESDFDQQKVGRVDQGKAAFPLRKANIDATDLLRLSSASLISPV